MFKCELSGPDHILGAKGSGAAVDRASVETAMSDQRGELDAFLGYSSSNQLKTNCYKPPLCEQLFTVSAALPESGLRVVNHGGPERG